MLIFFCMIKLPFPLLPQRESLVVGWLGIVVVVLLLLLFHNILQFFLWVWVVFLLLLLLLLSRGGVPRTQKLKSPLVGAQGYKRFTLSKPVGQHIDLHAAPADSASTYLVSAFPIHSTSFVPNVLQSQTAKCVINSESGCYSW